jgi:hypothetical protein
MLAATAKACKMRQMKLVLAALGLIVAVTAGPVVAATSGKSTKSTSGRNYMWIDKNGERQYGDAVPPEYSQGERRVLNNQGVELQREDARKNAQQLAEEKRRQQDVQQRQQHDRFLLTTYTSTRDIERLRDERLGQLEGQVKAAVLYIDSLDARLKTLQTRAQNFKPYSTKPDARRMPDDLAEELVRGSSEARAQRKALEKRRKDLIDVRAQFDADIARYKELTARAAAAAAG